LFDPAEFRSKEDVDELSTSCDHSVGEVCNHVVLAGDGDARSVSGRVILNDSPDQEESKDAGAPSCCGSPASVRPERRTGTRAAVHARALVAARTRRTGKARGGTGLLCHPPAMGRFDHVAALGTLIGSVDGPMYLADIVLMSFPPKVGSGIEVRGIAMRHLAGLDVRRHNKAIWLGEVVVSGSISDGILVAECLTVGGSVLRLD